MDRCMHKMMGEEFTLSKVRLNFLKYTCHNLERIVQGTKFFYVVQIQ